MNSEQQQQQKVDQYLIPLQNDDNLYMSIKTIQGGHSTWKTWNFFFYTWKIVFPGDF